MNIQQQRELFATIRKNQETFKKDPENFIPFGYETLDKDIIHIFDAEMDRAFFQYEKNKNK